MARDMITDTQQQDFLKEQFRREGQLWLRWYGRYCEPLLARRPPRHPPTPHHLRLPTLPAAPPAPPPAPRPPAPPEPPPLGPRIKEMKPVPPDVQALLYQGISHDGQGRWRYLRARAGLSPEDKYDEPITSSFDYGWQLGEVGAGVGHIQLCRGGGGQEGTGTASCADPVFITHFCPPHGARRCPSEGGLGAPYPDPLSPLCGAGPTQISVHPVPKCRIDSFFRRNGAFALLDPRDVAL
ncbi:protein ATP6V1FNB [Alligator mississippiensis]|uniref:protein ATP6V1FNB n=1 Tax=Alligator mississippiensis TaxID=8496 RepID=UPI0028779091|nr:protein ATP6V1FNB [Alligator mississippiensis]